MQNRFDIRSLVKSPIVGKVSRQVSQQFNIYENRLRRVVKDFDLRSREAREKGRRQIDRFADQIKSTRTVVERRVSGILNQEAKRLNERAVEIVKYIKIIANGEAVETPKQPRRARKSQRKTSAKRSTKKSGRR